eukprot:TRINITY_DN17613_c0_g1_i1.p1 TRINITY_DN17613_c0_g1~~TRINITY_DN17613_c0_g1_i1.p1  ORF type:complete len:429 (+),score=103.34 TRINITY_DN17613_c0_g1_i1:75-1361(+)
MATDQTQEEIKPLIDEKPQPVFEPTEQTSPPEENNTNTTGTTNNEITPTEDEPTSPQTKRHWKKTNLRKKKSKGDDQNSDSAQWPTPEEVRNLNASPQSQRTEPSRQPRNRYNERNSARSKRGISWKPLEVPNQGGAAPSAESQQSTTGQQGPSSSSSSNNNHYNGPPRSNKRRGGHRGGRGPWSSQGHQGQGQSQSQGHQQERPNHSRGPLSQQTPENNENGPVQQTPPDSSPSQVDEDNGAPVVNNQTNFDPQTQNQSGGNHNGDSRGYRNSRWGNRGRGGQSYGRGQGYYGPKYGRQNYPQQPQNDDEQMKDLIKKQVEYYFSMDNLCKDVYLRQNMDKLEGWISIFMILNFRRVRELVGADYNLLADTLKDSEVVEISEDKKLIRRRSDWRIWVYPPLVDTERPAIPDSSVDPTPVQSSETTVN